MHSAEWLGWHNNIILQCPADLLQILLACWLPLILVPCGCRGAVWETAGKITYAVLSKHCPKQQVHAGVSIPGKTLSSNFYQICFVTWIDFFFKSYIKNETYCVYSNTLTLKLEICMYPVLRQVEVPRLPPWNGAVFGQEALPMQLCCSQCPGRFGSFCAVWV